MGEEKSSHVPVLTLLTDFTCFTVSTCPKKKEEILVAYKKKFEELETLFDITLRLIVEQSLEILNVSTMIYTSSSWMRSTLLNDTVIEWTKAKVHVYSDSVLCLEKMHDY